MGEQHIRLKGVKPRLILLLAILVECLLLLVAFSRHDDASQQATPPSTEWRNDPTPERERAIRRENLWKEWKPRLVWTLLVANGVFTIAFAVRTLRRPQVRRQG
jgi:hypothetical protein